MRLQSTFQYSTEENIFSFLKTLPYLKYLQQIKEKHLSEGDDQDYHDHSACQSSCVEVGVTSS